MVFPVALAHYHDSVLSKHKTTRIILRQEVVGLTAGLSIGGLGRDQLWGEYHHNTV